LFLRASEEDRRELAGKIPLYAEGLGRGLDQFHILSELGGIVAELLVQHGVVQSLDGEHILCNSHAAGPEEVKALVIQVVDPFEGGAHADGPRQRAHRDGKLGFQLVQELEGVPTLTVQLINEDDDRRCPHAADLHEFLGLLLHALDAVHDQDHAVHGCERAIGVLGEVLVARCVEQVDLDAVVVESHD
jgi:hypothetical protein